MTIYPSYHRGITLVILLCACNAEHPNNTPVGDGGAATEQMPKLPVGVPLATALQETTLRLSAVEGTLTKIERSRLVQAGDGEAIEQGLFEYAQQMVAAADRARQEAEGAGRSGGLQGSVQALKLFEDTAEAHRARIEQVPTRMQAIEQRLQRAEIKLDRPVIEAMTPAELTEFAGFLAPEGLQEMRRLYPKLFEVKVLPLPKHGSLQPHLSPRRAAGAAAGFCGTMSQRVGQFFLGQARASAAVPCIGPCWSHNWPVCLGCVVNFGNQVIGAYNSFVNCWNGSCGCRWYRPWCCAAKAWCVVKLIAVLA